MLRRERPSGSGAQHGSSVGQLPCVPDSVRRFRQSDQRRYIAGLIRFLSAGVKKCHPLTDVGWWCGYEEQMRDLVTFLSEPDPSLHDLWYPFRREVAKQLSFCRQCARAYHKAAKEWELSKEVSVWSKEVMERRVNDLLEWDVHRLTPALEKGVNYSPFSTDADILASKTQCREAFLEAILSLRICMHRSFSSVLDKIFRTQHPVLEHEDVVLFIREFGAIPPGLAVLCFYSSETVRAWAKSLYIYSRNELRLNVDGQALRLLVSKSLCIAAGKAESVKDSCHVVCAKNQRGIWGGVYTLVATIPLKLLGVMVKAYEKFPIIDALYKFFRLIFRERFASEPPIGFHDALRSFRRVLAATPFLSLFGRTNLTQEVFLEAIFQCFELCSLRQSERNTLLEVVFDIPSSAMRGLKSDARTLFSRCLGFLEDMARPHRTRLFHHLKSESLTMDFENEFHGDVLATGAQLLQKFYWHFWPQFPMDDRKRLAEFVIMIVREIPERACSWELLRIALLTDVCSLLSYIFGSGKVVTILETFFCASQEMGGVEESRSSPLREGITKMLMPGMGSTQISLHWMDDLWKSVTDGAHISKKGKHSDKVYGSDVRLALDLHRLAGVLDLHRCGTLIEDVLHSSMPPQENCGKIKRVILQRTETILRAILSRLESTREDSDVDINLSLGDLPLQAAHLLTSTHKGISLLAHRALLTRYKIHNATCAGSQSRDRLLVHILQKNEEDRRMLLQGFKSLVQTVSTQSAAVSARTYTSFFRWYSLLASRDCRILWDTNIAREALGILYRFLESLEHFQAIMTPESFSETVCRLFSTIPTISDCLKDYERSMFRTITGEENYFNKSIHPLYEKVAMKLLELHWMRDKLALDAWVRMLTQDTMRVLVKGIGARGILKGVLRKSQESRGPLDFVQCRRLSDAYDLAGDTEFPHQQVATSKTERKHREAFRSLTTKTCRETRIDDLYSNGISKSNRLAGRASQKRSILSCPAVSTRSNSYLRDLRRGHRQARAEFRRAAAGSGPTPRNIEPVKTRFELLREERIAQREKEKAEAQNDVHIRHRLEAHLEESYPQDCLDGSPNESNELGSDWHNRSQERTRSQTSSYPKSCRILKTRSIEQVKRDLLIPEDPPSLETELYTKAMPQKFPDVESYVNYWEPLLIAEFRSTIRRRVQEERLRGEHMEQGTGGIDSRRVFAVDGPVEDIGYLHTLSITCHHQNPGSWLNKHDFESHVKPFDVSKEKASDIVLLEISEPGTVALPKQHDTSHVLLAIVSSVLRTKSKTQLSLLLVFDGISAPGKGRKLRVRSLVSFTTLHRQLHALWSLPRVQDGIMWSLMDPTRGWSIKRDMEARDEQRVDRNLSLPMQVIEKIERLGLLNASQCKAVADVVRSCQPLFAEIALSKRSQCKKHNVSSISLVQGPPGTGKTSTIVALLSALLSGIGSQPCTRKVKVVAEGISMVTTIPAIRILVCAPSNAAVDEIMIRVMNEGLFTSSDHRICPRIVRVGHGTTIRALQALEVHSMAKSHETQLFSEKKTAPCYSRDYQELLKVNNQIGELEADRKNNSIRAHTKSHGKSSGSRTSFLNSERVNEINEKLHILHEKRKLLSTIVVQEREARNSKEVCVRQDDARAVLKTLATASLVFATLSSSGHEDMKSLGASFDVVIIDEAGQSCEPEALIPMTIGQPKRSVERRFMHTVLVGDPKQLPPTVISSNQTVARALGRSLFERIAHVDPSTVHLLDTQYRMHPKISSFPCFRFYDGLLLNSSRVKDKGIMHKPWHFDAKNRFGPLTLFDTANTYAKEVRNRNGSLSNEIEAEFVIQGILSMLKLFGKELFAESIVLLSPYKQQVQLLKRLIASNAVLKEVKVEASTIDGIQGREKSVVVLSTVRSGHSRDIGFVNDDRRLNVALTRAMHSLMIFGHAEFLSKHSGSWAALVSHCRERSRVIPLGSGRTGTFTVAGSVLGSQLPQGLPAIDELPDIEDEATSDLFRKDSRDTATAAQFNDQENVNVLDDETSSLFGAGCPSKSLGASLTQRQDQLCVTEDMYFQHHKRQRQGFFLESATTLGRPMKRINDRPRPHNQAYALATIHSPRESFRYVEKPKRKLLKSETGAIHTVWNHPGEKEGLNRYTGGKLERSKLFVSQLGRNVAREDQDQSISSLARQTIQSYPGDRQVSISKPSGLSRGQGNTKITRDQISTMRVSSRRSNSLPDCDPMHTARVSKKARVGTSGKLSFCRGRGSSSIPGHHERNMADSLQTSRRAVQKNPAFLNKRQAKQRLLLHNNRNYDRRDRRDCFSTPGSKKMIQAQSRKVLPAFSLADTKAKLQLTLEAARRAKK